MRKLKIGLCDDTFYSLQSRLANDGHTVIVYMGSSDPIENFDVCKHERGEIIQAHSLHHMYDANCDLVICGTTNYNEISAYDFFTGLGVPTLGYSASTTLLELDRGFAQTINSKLGIDKIIFNPQALTFTDIEEAIEFLEHTEEDWVLKQSPQSPQHIQENRTWVSLYKNHRSTISLLKGKNAWFYPEGHGGVILEKFIRGQEVCFGAWFDGEKFHSPIYSCIEHKGAQNFDRGSMLTGEVGSTMNLHSYDLNTKVGKTFDLLAPYLKGKCNGMIDINTIILPNGDLYFVEYTARFGRPTLEIQLSLLNDIDLGDVLYSLASGPVSQKYLEEFAYKMGTYATAVTVFSYGIPFIKQHDPKADSPTALTLAFDMPEIQQGITAVTQPLFCCYNNQEGHWQTAPTERQFTVVGLASIPQDSISNAYAPLKNYSLPTCTWRDDVGLTFADTENFISCNRIV